jgi:hypothetical protein
LAVYDESYRAQRILSLSSLSKGDMVYISILTGYLISLALAIVFEKFALFFIVVPGIIVACNMARSKEIVVSFSIAALLDLTLFILLIKSGLYHHSELLFRELGNYAANLFIAAALGYGYSKSKKNK